MKRKTLHIITCFIAMLSLIFIMAMLQAQAVYIQSKRSYFFPEHSCNSSKNVSNDHKNARDSLQFIDVKLKSVEKPTLWTNYNWSGQPVFVRNGNVK